MGLGAVDVENWDCFEATQHADEALLLGGFGVPPVSGPEPGEEEVRVQRFGAPLRTRKYWPPEAFPLEAPLSDAVPGLRRRQENLLFPGRSHAEQC